MTWLIALVALALLFLGWYSPNTARRRAVDEGKESGGPLDSIRRALGGSTANTRRNDKAKEPLDKVSALSLTMIILAIPIVWIIYIIRS